jgi:hypothetical protein
MNDLCEDIYAFLWSSQAYMWMPINPHEKQNNIFTQTYLATPNTHTFTSI